MTVPSLPVLEVFNGFLFFSSLLSLWKRFRSYTKEAQPYRVVHFKISRESAMTTTVDVKDAMDFCGVNENT